jgi:glycosyltransferase involved in cell wall biosynthesis
MSRILLVLTDPPLPFGDAAARWYYVLMRGLVERGHDVTAFVVCGDHEQASEVSERFPASGYDVRLYAPSARRGPLRKLETLRRPYSYRFSPELRRDLDTELARGADVLHLEQLWCGWLGLEHVDRAVLSVHYLFDIDFSDQPPASLIDHLRRGMTLRAERHLLRRYPTIATLTPRLSDRVHQLSPRSRVHTVPLGLDVSLYPFEPGESATHDPVVGLIGSFRWHPTYWAGVRLLTKLWPEIKHRVPRARLQIVGRRARAALGDLASGPDISVAEDVADTIPYFRALDVLLYAPSRGSGMKVKVLEAFALGVPVVTTSEGIEGLPAQDGVHAGVCDDDEGLIERTVALLHDPERRGRQRVAARALLEAHCTPGPTLDRLEQVYATLTRADRGEHA